MLYLIRDERSSSWLEEMAADCVVGWRHYGGAVSTHLLRGAAARDNPGMLGLDIAAVRPSTFHFGCEKGAIVVVAPELQERLCVPRVSYCSGEASAAFRFLAKHCGGANKRSYHAHAGRLAHPCGDATG